MKRSALLLSVALVLVPAVAKAAPCRSHDLDGQWNLYITGADGAWLRCFVTLAAPTVKSTICMDSGNVGYALTGGTFNLTSSPQCVYRMVLPIGSFNYVVRFMSPNASLDVVAGVGTAKASPSSVSASQNISLMMTLTGRGSTTP